MKVVVIGMGNLLAADDGVGIWAVRELQSSGTDERVSFVECERGGLELLDLLAGCDGAVIIDALRTDCHTPGSVLTFAFHTPFFYQSSSSLHTIGLDGVLAFGCHMGISLPPEVTVIGVEVQDTESFGAPLTAEVASALPRVVETVKCRLRELVLRTRRASHEVSDSIC